MYRVSANDIYSLCELRRVADLPPDTPVRVVSQRQDTTTGRWERTVTVQVVPAADAGCEHAFVTRQTLRTLDEAVRVGTPRMPEGLTGYTKGIVALAESKGLRPMWRTGKARHELILSSPGPHGPSGCIVVGARSGKVLRCQITHGAGGSTTPATGTNAVRALLSSLTPPACPPFCHASSVESCEGQTS
jgi:hypothetical protein